MTDKRYAHESGNLMTVQAAVKLEDPNMRGAKYPLLPGVMVHLKLQDWTPASIDPDTEVALSTWTEVGGVAVQDKRVKTTDELNAVEEMFIAQEMAVADIEIRKWADGHARTTGASIQQWRSYRNDLRDHIIGGVVQGARPTRPGV